MSALPKSYITPEQYLLWERQQATKHEYWNGQVYAMAGASARHNLISGNVGAALRTKLRGRDWRIYLSNLRIRVPATGFYTYADVIVVCGKPQFDDSELDTLLNPTLIVEVLSKSTESYDRGTKFQNYRSLDSLMEYVLIDQNGYYIEQYVRQAEGQWLFSEVKGADGILHLPTLDCTLALAEVYDQVDFPSPRLRDPAQTTR